MLRLPTAALRDLKAAWDGHSVNTLEKHPNMHETHWRKEIAKWMRRKWPRDTFIEESYLPYGSRDIESMWAQPDILRISANGRIDLIEVKKRDNPEIKKWLILGQLNFYTFLIDTQYYQDNDKFKWMEHLITHGLHSQSTVDAIEKRFKNRQTIVRSWCVVFPGSTPKSLECDDLLWHMHDYVNRNSRSNSAFRPMFYFTANGKRALRCTQLKSWFHK